MIDTIVFFHAHVNGDCYLTRKLVSYIIKNTQNNNIKYYYTALRSFGSYCQDIGIPNENFNHSACINKITQMGWQDQNIHKEKVFYIENDILYIDVWIGYVLSKKSLCCMCLKNAIPYWNNLIREINNECNFNIDMIPIDDNPYLPIKYQELDLEFLDIYINEKKKKYKKVILIYNITPTTIFLNIDNKNIVTILSETYKNYFFITFTDLHLDNTNIVSFKTIYDQNNKTLPVAYGFEFSYLSNICEHVICCMSGICQFTFNYENMNNKDKIMMIVDLNNNPASRDLVCTQTTDEFLCTDIYNLYINMHHYNTDMILCKDIIRFIKDVDESPIEEC